MATFEDQLWTDLLGEHGTELAGASRSATRRSRTKPILVTAGTFGVVGVATAVALTLTATAGPPAYAVTTNPDGTVSVTINQIVGVSGANAELARLHVRARAVPENDDCTANPPQQVPTNVFGGGALRGQPVDGVTIVPDAIPAGDTLMLVAKTSGNSGVLAAIMVRGPVPSCFGGPHSGMVLPGPLILSTSPPAWMGRPGGSQGPAPADTGRSAPPTNSGAPVPATPSR
jgi:hypothetical protein